MADDALIPPGPVAQWLKERRRLCNQRFELARRTWPALDGPAVLAQVRDLLAPVAAAIHAVRPDAMGAAADELFDWILDLCREGLLGPGARAPLPADGLRDLLVAAARPMAVAPRQVARAMASALANLRATPGADGAGWLRDLTGLAARAPDPATLLALGQVLAWRHGLAHFRAGALDLCAGLGLELGPAALGCAAADPARWPEALKALREDPWLAPAAALGQAPDRRALRVVRAVGGFRGLGGPFLQLPRVGGSATALLAWDDQRPWLITADLFGATLHAVDAPAPAAPPCAAPFAVALDGTVTLGGQARAFPELAGVTGAVSDGHTLAVATRWSYHVFLVAHAG